MGRQFQAAVLVKYHIGKANYVEWLLGERESDRARDRERESERARDLVRGSGIVIGESEWPM